MDAALGLPLLPLGAVYGAAAGVFASVVAHRRLPSLLFAYGLLALPMTLYFWLPPPALQTRLWSLLGAGVLAIAAFCLWLAACRWFERFRMKDR
jgi:hypothetical protein